MTAAAPAARVRSLWPSSRTSEATPATVVPPLVGWMQLVRAVLVVVGVLAVAGIAELLVVSPLQQRAAQQRAYDRLRAELATGTAPVSAADLGGKVGAPIAYLEIPSIGLRQVVVEGTTAGALMTGPGHRRDTAWPGHSGTSYVFGRRAAFGGPFSRVHELRAGAVIHVTTGAGVVDYRVRGVRRSGDTSTPVRAGSGRLVLATADGRAFVPSGAVFVDADLAVPPLGAARAAVAPVGLPAPERVMAVDGSTLWRLLLWLQALLVVVLGAELAWHRWHRAKAWVVFLPPMLLVGLMTAGESARLLPNLL